MAKTIITNNMFMYGEVGKRLAGIRESEVARGSAQKIRNFYVTELGNLKISKKYNVYASTISDIIDVLDTRYTFYLVVTKTSVYSVNKDTNAILYSRPVTITNENTNCKMFEDSLIICTPTPQVFEFDKNTGNIGSSNFLTLLSYPILEKEIVKIELFRVYEITVSDKKEFRVTSLAKYDDPKLEVKEGGIFFESSNIKLDRIYKQQRSTIDKETITGISAGLTFGVLENYYDKVVEGDKTKQYILGNTNIEFTGETNDPLYGGSYFTGINVQTKGKLSWGQIKTLTDNFTDAGVLGPRMYIIKDDMLFFSKIENFFDFRNDINDDSPFYFKPGPINNQRPLYLRSKAGNNLYLSTNKGVYVISYDKVLTGSSYKVFIASETPCTWECELVGDNFFYISDDEVIKCVQPVPNQLGYESYRSFTVEKFSIESIPKRLTKINIEGVTKLVSEIGGNVVDIYDVVDINIFRKTSLDINYTKKIFGYNQNYVSEKTFFVKSNINYKEAVLTLNPPYLKTKNGGTYCNDYSSKIEKVVVKALNGSKDAIKGMFITEIAVNNQAPDSDDFSVYAARTDISVGNGYSVKIVSKENDEVLEILGLDTVVNVAGDD